MPNVTEDRFGLSGHIACVTGASSGLRHHTLAVLAGAGAKVAGVARREEHLKGWHAPLGGRVGYTCHHLMDKESLGELASWVNAIFEPLDIFVHSAAIHPRQTADEMTQEGWDDKIWLNLSVPFLLSCFFVPAIKTAVWGR